VESRCQLVQEHPHAGEVVVEEAENDEEAEDLFDVSSDVPESLIEILLVL